MSPEQYKSSCEHLDSIQRYAESIVGGSGTGTVKIVVTVENGRAKTVYGKISPSGATLQSEIHDQLIKERLRCLHVIEARMLELMKHTQYRQASDEEREINLRVYKILNAACQQIRELPLPQE